MNVSSGRPGRNKVYIGWYRRGKRKIKSANYFLAYRSHVLVCGGIIRWLLPPVSPRIIEKLEKETAPRVWADEVGVIKPAAFGLKSAGTDHSS